MKKTIPTTLQIASIVQNSQPFLNDRCLAITLYISHVSVVMELKCTYIDEEIPEMSSDKITEIRCKDQRVVINSNSKTNVAIVCCFNN